MRSISQRLRAGETVLGSWLVLGSSVTAEITGGLGFDWLLVDLEHGLVDEQRALHMLQGLSGSTAVPIVRVESHQRQRVHRMLDMGACGIMFPQIRSAAEAREAVAAMQYPPEGVRGVARMVRATSFGLHFDTYLQACRDQLLGVMQIENEQVLEDLDEIAALPGVDVLFIGPSDMTMGMGIFRQFDHPRFQDAVRRTAEAAHAAGKAAGVLLGSPSEFAMYRDLGYQFIAMGSDASFVAAGASEALASMRRQLQIESPPVRQASAK